jgi:hypothetical protein
MTESLEMTPALCGRFLFGSDFQAETNKPGGNNRAGFFAEAN